MSAYTILALALMFTAALMLGFGIGGVIYRHMHDERVRAEWDGHTDAALRLTSDTPMYADLRAEYLVREIAEWEAQR